ncbi:hypothetical protein Atai01_08810 [Amycolatopsis taiwanensis]|uniref:Uncharacterized protein n=2 Tax=Amycolatopsis taiwanensis TaxID=342230 RepID=A0A9W6QY99_9PSEU|nr:hypothetical protein Atai01_08810 [Amycolatopsis taiwanensis]
MEKLHGRPVAEAPRWAVWAAYATTLIVLPSCVWRIAGFAFDAPVLDPALSPPDAPGRGVEVFSGWGYVIILSIVSEALAFLTMGLVCTWGEVFPRWIPRLGGRPVPVRAAVIPAGLGAAALMIFPYALFMLAMGRTINGTPGTGVNMHGWQTIAFWVSYTPLAAWGPLLGILTVHYYRRRRGLTAGAIPPPAAA